MAQRQKYAISFCILACAISAPAAAQEIIRTNEPLTIQQQVFAQAQEIQAQRAQIDALREELREVTAMLATRIDRTEAQTENGRVILSTPGARLESPNSRNTLAFVGAVQVTAGTADEDNTDRSRRLRMEGPKSSVHALAYRVRRSAILLMQSSLILPRMVPSPLRRGIYGCSTTAFVRSPSRSGT